MTNEVIHNFCESRLDNNEPPEILNSYTSLFITIIPLINGLPNNIIFFNVATMLIFNGFASFYYHYTLTWIGKQSDEISMIMATYYGLSGLIKLLYTSNQTKRKLFYGINNIFMLLFLIFNTNIETDKFFPYIFSFYILIVLIFIHNVSNKYKYINCFKNNCSYKYELLTSSIGAISWIISELYCNEYTKYGHVLWHLLFPLGFYRLILKFDDILINY